MQELEPIQTNLHNRINVCIKNLIGSFPYAFAYRPINFFMHTFMRLCKFVWIGLKTQCIRPDLCFGLNFNLKILSTRARERERRSLSLALVLNTLRLKPTAHGTIFLTYVHIKCSFLT